MISTNPAHRPVLRILAVGDCNTGGVEGAPPETRMPVQVAARLESAGFSCELRNLGRTMSTSREGVARIRSEGTPADLLLLNFGLVDAWVTTIPRVYIAYYPDNLVRKWGRKLLKSLKRRLRAGWLRRWVPVGEVVPIAEYERNIQAILDVAREQNPGVFCVLWGTVTVPADQARTGNIARYNACLRRIADSHPGTTYLDAADCIREFDVGEAYVDRVHISQRAAERIAAEVAHVCLQRPEIHHRAA